MGTIILVIALLAITIGWLLGHEEDYPSRCPRCGLRKLRPHYEGTSVAGPTLWRCSACGEEVRRQRRR